MNDSYEDQVLERLRPKRKIAASHFFKERVMKAIAEENAGTGSKVRRNNWPRWAMLGCAAAILILILPMLPSGTGKSPGIALLAQSVQAMSNVQTVHITGRIRTLPGDNFEIIGTDYEFVPIEIWREYANPPRWRIEKPGRIVVMDGASATLYMAKSNEAVKGTPSAGFVEWLRPLLDPQSILERELAAARQGSAQAYVNELNGVLTATLQRAARGDFANDWARNKSIPESDHNCVYRFDAATKRLQSLQVIVKAAGKEVVVADFDTIRYNEQLSSELFTLQLPTDVDWLSDRPSKAVRMAFSGPREVAVFFFDSLARRDWDSVLQVSSGKRVPDMVQRMYGGLKVIQIGEPFHSGIVPGYFVPYQVHLSDGTVKSHKLHVRNDNPTQQWIVDGGY